MNLVMLQTCSLRDGVNLFTLGKVTGTIFSGVFSYTHQRYLQDSFVYIQCNCHVDKLVACEVSPYGGKIHEGLFR